MWDDSRHCSILVQLIRDLWMSPCIIQRQLPTPPSTFLYFHWDRYWNSGRGQGKHLTFSSTYHPWQAHLRVVKKSAMMQLRCHEGELWGSYESVARCIHRWEAPSTPILMTLSRVFSVGKNMCTYLSTAESLGALQSHKDMYLCKERGREREYTSIGIHFNAGTLLPKIVPSSSTECWRT